MAIEKVVVPVDFSENSEQALSVAVDLARTLGAEIHVVHVVPTVPYFGPPFVPGPVLIGQVKEAGRKELDALMARLRARGINASAVLAEGVAYTEIDRAAADLGADLIVIGTHGRTGFQHLLLGSVAERVVRMSRIPVMVVPPKNKAGEPTK